MIILTHRNLSYLVVTHRNYDHKMMEQAASCTTLHDLRKVFETNFWNDVSDDEGIGSDDSEEAGAGGSVTDNDSEREISSTVKQADQARRSNAIQLKIKRSKSLVAINQLSSRLFHQISRKFSDPERSYDSRRCSQSRAASSGAGRSGQCRIDVFGCELSELCRKTDCEVPEIVTFCVEKIEQIGITDGIYRISGSLILIDLINDD